MPKEINGTTPIHEEQIISKILLIRDKRVMLDSDLSALYFVATKVLNQAVKRNISRFPEDFMFQLNEKEFDDLKSQFVTSSWGGRRTLPFAFTEHGVAMLSSVLKSEVAVQANILIIRVFFKMREMVTENQKLLSKINTVEKVLMEHEIQFENLNKDIYSIFGALEDLIHPEEETRKPIGFNK
jgi:hypothetical protein